MVAVYFFVANLAGKDVLRQGEPSRHSSWRTFTSQQSTTPFRSDVTSLEARRRFSETNLQISLIIRPKEMYK